MKKRNIEIAVISDVHLGSIGCRAEELLVYLNSIQPKMLILNGDIVAIDPLNKRFFPSSHMKVLQKVLGMASKGTQVYYLSGNHDAILRKLGKTVMGNLYVQDKLILGLDGKKAWFFHGDAFDAAVQNAKWLLKLGRCGYALLLALTCMGDKAASFLGYQRSSLSQKTRGGSNEGQTYITKFEKTACDIAIMKGYHYVVCGHVHKPKKEHRITDKGQCTYLNSGDWITNLTALEYSFKRWKLYRYNHDKLAPFFADEELKQMPMHELVATISDRKEPVKKSVS